MAAATGSPRFEVKPPDHRRTKAPSSPRSYHECLLTNAGTISPRSSGFVHDRGSSWPCRPELTPLGIPSLLEPSPRPHASQRTNQLTQSRQPVKCLGNRGSNLGSRASTSRAPPAVDVHAVGLEWVGVSGRRRARLRAAVSHAELRVAAPRVTPRAEPRAELDTECEAAEAEARSRPRLITEAEATGFLSWAEASSPPPTAAELLLARCVGTEAYHRCVGRTAAEPRHGVGGRLAVGSSQSPPKARAAAEATAEADVEALLLP